MEYEGKQINFKWDVKPLYSSIGTDTPSFECSTGDALINIRCSKEEVGKELARVTRKIERRYEILTQERVGYKLMYQEFTLQACVDTDISYDEPHLKDLYSASIMSNARLMLPVLVQVTIPKGCISYGNEQSYFTCIKHRANAGIIDGFETMENTIRMSCCIPNRIIRPYATIRRQAGFMVVDGFETMENTIRMSCCIPNRNLFSHHDRRLYAIEHSEFYGDTVILRPRQYGDRFSSVPRMKCKLINVNPGVTYSMYEFEEAKSHRWLEQFGNEFDLDEVLRSIRAYHVGDHIDIPDFDFQPKTCSTGFHYFKTAGEAVSYCYT